MRRNNLTFFYLIVLLIVFSFLEIYTGPIKNPEWGIILNLRLPRIILALIIGTNLAISGVVLQSVFANPLIDPYISSASAGAAWGIIISHLLSLPDISGAIVFSLLSVFAAYQLSRKNFRTTSTRLVLSGVTLNTFLNALIVIFFLIYRRDFYQLLFFLFGNLNENNWELIGLSLPVSIAGFFWIYRLNKHLDIISLGDDKSATLGISPENLKIQSFLVVALLTGISVVLGGIIGFVGLITPHILRILIGSNNKKLIPAAALGGTILLLLSDLISRNLAPPQELPLGVITALLGVPYFLYLLRRQ